MNLETLTQSTGEWLRGTGPESDIVMSSRVRLARNLPHYPFVSRASDQDRADIERSIEQMVNKLLHPPLEALRDEAREGTPHGLLDALRRLFRLSDG